MPITRFKGSTGGTIWTPQRREVTITTPDLQTGENIQLFFLGSPSFYCYEILSDKPARIRIYANQQKQAADLNRPVPLDLESALNQAANGILLDVVLSTELSISLSPAVVIPLTIGNQAPVTITNMSSNAASVEMRLIILEIEKNA
jgi:hypothetical protein